MDGLKAIVVGFILFVIGLLCLQPTRAQIGMFQWFKPAAGDPFFSSVVLLVSGIGTNGSTTIPDLSPLALGNGTITGSPTISTTTPVNSFSSSIVTAGSTGGNTDYVVWGNGTNPPTLNTPSVGAAVWTIEIAWKPASDGTVFGWGGIWVGAGTFGGFVDNNADGSFRIFAGDPAGLKGFDFSSAASQWTAGTSYWLIIESNGTKMRLYLGDLTGTTATMIASTTTFTTENALYLGNVWLSYYGFAGQSSGKFNWWRITNGVARYNSDSPVAIPTFPLPNF